MFKKLKEGELVTAHVNGVVLMSHNPTINMVHISEMGVSVVEDKDNDEQTLTLTEREE